MLKVESRKLNWLFGSVLGIAKTNPDGHFSMAGWFRFWCSTRYLSWFKSVSPVAINRLGLSKLVLDFINYDILRGSGTHFPKGHPHVTY